MEQERLVSFICLTSLGVTPSPATKYYMLILKKILSQFTYVHKLRVAVGHAMALSDLIGVHGAACCEHDCIGKSAARFYLEHREFEDLAYKKDEWEEWHTDGSNFLG